MCVCACRSSVFTIEVFIVVYVFSQSGWNVFLNEVLSVVREEVMYQDVAKHLQLTSNIKKKKNKKTPTQKITKKSSQKCLPSQLGLFGVFQR